MIMTEGQLRSVVRKSIIQHERNVLEEGIVRDAIEWVKEKGRAGYDGAKKFFEGLKEELSQTGEGLNILGNLALQKEVPKEKIKFLKNQIIDLAKGLPLLSMFVLPGGGLAATALVQFAKKFDVDLMPSSFSSKDV